MTGVRPGCDAMRRSAGHPRHSTGIQRAARSISVATTRQRSGGLAQGTRRASGVPTTMVSAYLSDSVAALALTSASGQQRQQRARPQRQADERLDDLVGGRREHAVVAGQQRRAGTGTRRARSSPAERRRHLAAESPRTRSVRPERSP